MIDLNGKLRLHHGMTHDVVRVGRDRTPVLVVDNFLSDPAALVAYAEACAFQPAGANYPGLRATAPPIYLFAVRAFLGELIQRVFGLASAEVAGEKCDFSLVTTRADNLQPVQRIPHIDNTNPKHFAVLHFLCDERYGGTAFYRHRATDLEIVTDVHYPAYEAAIEQELASRPPPARYIDGDSDAFERIASFDAAPNRVLVYRGWSPHSANIPGDFQCDARPRFGRLTANAFFYFR